MMNKLNLFKKISLACLFVSLLVPALVIGGQSFGWFIGFKYNEVSVDSEININYFNGGNGTAPGPGQTYKGGELTGPYQINNARQLYHFSWLQEMGYFNRLNEEGIIEPVYFVLTDDIDMTGAFLPSIGTQDYQFIGHFDGMGHTVSNLYITNDKEKYSNDPTSRTDILHYGGVEIVGFFGVIGSLDGDGANTANVIGEDGKTPVSGYTYDTSVNEVSNFYIDTCTIETQTDNTLIGLAAGYVNGKMDRVGVIDSSIVLKSKGALSPSLTRNYSDYSLVGFCQPSYRGTFSSERTTIVDPIITQEQIVIDDPGSAPGASIDMLKMFNRLTDIKNNEATTNLANYQFNVTEKYMYEEGTGRKIFASADKDTMNNWHPTNNNNIAMRLHESEDEGKFNFYNNQSTYLFLYGANEENDRSKTLEEIEYDTEDIPGFFIMEPLESEGAATLCMNSAKNGVETKYCSEVEDIYSSTIFAFDDSKEHIYTDVFNTPYYLNVVNGTLSMSQTASTIWNITETDLGSGMHSATFSTVVGGLTRSIAFDGTEFILFTPGSYITYDGNYLTLGNNNSIANTRNKASASIWTFRYNNNGYYVYASNGTQDIYLRYNNGLTTTTNINYATLWNLDDTSGKTSIYYNNNYIFFENTWQCGVSSYTEIDWDNMPFYITDGTHYMNVNTNNTTITNTNEPTSACKWYFSNPQVGGDGGYIYTIIGGRTFYIYNDCTRFIGIVWNRSLGLTTYAPGSSGAPEGSSEYLYTLTEEHRLTVNAATGKALTYSNGWTYTGAGGSSGGVQLVLPTTTVYRNLGEKVNIEVNTTVFRLDTVFHGTKVVDAEETHLTGYTTSFPLTSLEERPYNVRATNTGYVTSGGFAVTPNDGGNGDIRVSRYPKSDISNSYSTQTQKLTNIRTINNRGDVVIQPTDKFYKLDNSRTIFESTLASDSNIYGLHFMDASISMDHIIHQDKAVVLNKTYYDYELPMDSIDFNLSTRGFINFFAGTYYDNDSARMNDSFFTLHQIFRDQWSTITAIKEIHYVYGVLTEEGVIDEEYEYIYQYADGTYSREIPTLDDGRTYEVLFDTDWIKYHESIKTNNHWVYYYEIPANRGEFALGSVSEHNGAYLMYLDLSCNKQLTNRTVTTTGEKVAKNIYEYAEGVEFLSSEEEPFELDDQSLSAQFSISEDKENGTITYTKTLDEDGATISPDSTDDMYVTMQGEYADVPEGMVTVPKRQEYLDTYDVVKFDDAISVGAQIRSEISYSDYLVYEYGEFVSFSRTIETTVYYCPDGTAASEVELLSFAFTDYPNQLLFNFEYIFNMFENKFSFTVYMNIDCNAEITYVNNDYVLYMNGTSINGGVPSSKHINAATEPYAPLVDINPDIPVI